MTTHGPVGSPSRQPAKKPITKQAQETTAATLMTRRKLPDTRMAVKAGKTTRAEIIMAPMSFIPTTITTAVSMAINRLQKPVRAPEARANASSKVTAKIR